MKFTRRHVTSKVVTQALEAATLAAGAHADGEAFQGTLSDQSLWIRLSGRDPQGPIRCGFGHANDFEAASAAYPVLVERLAHFSNLKIHKHCDSVRLDWSGVQPSSDPWA